MPQTSILNTVVIGKLALGSASCSTVKCSNLFYNEQNKSNVCVLSKLGSQVSLPEQTSSAVPGERKNLLLVLCTVSTEMHQTCDWCEANNNDPTKCVEDGTVTFQQKAKWSQYSLAWNNIMDKSLFYVLLPRTKSLGQKIYICLGCSLSLSSQVAKHLDELNWGHVLLHRTRDICFFTWATKVSCSAGFRDSLNKGLLALHVLEDRLLGLHYHFTETKAQYSCRAPNC
jgi:hypothetical protein